MITVVVPEVAEYPRVVCLCGSTRFVEAFGQVNLQETLAGRIVLSIGCDTKRGLGLHLSEEDKARLDELHLRKIEFADEVFVVNPGGYVGCSTACEIEYAWALRKPIRWLEVPPYTLYRFEGRERGYPPCDYDLCGGEGCWWCDAGRGGWFCCREHAFLFGSPVPW